MILYIIPNLPYMSAKKEAVAEKDVLPVQRYARDIENMQLLYYHFNRPGNPKKSQSAIYRELAEEKVAELKLRK